MKNLLAFALLVYLFCSCNGSAAEKSKADKSLASYTQPLDPKEYQFYHKKLTDFFDSGLLRSGFNGSILVAKNGTVVYENYVGKTDLRKKDPITDTTAIHVASTSKTFTAIAILQLVQENKLALTDSLEKFFPGFPYPGITIKMLLSHRSGLPNYLYFMSNNKWGILPNGRWNREYATNSDVLQMMYDKIPDPVARPDSRFNYCNTNFMLLASIIEKISGKPFPVYMQEKLFGPLQMNHTYIFTLKDTLTATPSFTASGRWWNFDFLDATYGDKNVYTTPRDLLKWDQALYSSRIINQSLLDSAFTPRSFEKPGIHNYGFGWRLISLPNSKKVIYHFGKWHGNNAAFARLTDEKATIIILGNKFNRNIYSVAHLCYDIFGDYMQNHGEQEDDSDNPEASPSLKMARKEPAPVKKQTKTSR